MVADQGAEMGQTDDRPRASSDFRIRAIIKLMKSTPVPTGKKNVVVGFDGIKLHLVHYCVENGIRCESSVPLDRCRDANRGLDDVKVVEACNDDKAPLLFRPKVPIPADAVTGSANGFDPHISQPSGARSDRSAWPRLAAFPWCRRIN
jgi:hypothetical protein